MQDAIRVLFLADTHLGLDLPTRARIQRRRRGHDFLANYATALQPALGGEVDVVVHGGDVFNRSRVATSVAWQAFEPLARIADRGVEVFVVPGNHERGRIPQLRFAQHPRIHIFDRPRTVELAIRGVRLTMSGFPSEREDVRHKFVDLVEATGWRQANADVRVLCMHQCVEGATVGPADYVFTTAADVVRGADLPAGFSAVLSGHIHRHQVLTTDLRGRQLPVPVLYPGSIERTSFAEAAEEKGYLSVRLRRDCGVEWQFHPLPARPLVRHQLRVEAGSGESLEVRLRSLIAELSPDAVLTLRVTGAMTEDVARVLSAANLRRLAPASMNVDVRAEDWPRAVARSRQGAEGEATPELPF